VKISAELKDVLKQACKEVDSWEPWQRSRDPQGSEEGTPRVSTTASDARSPLVQQRDRAVMC
jgi:hypothetical protein